MSRTIRFLSLSLMLVALACIGPQGSHREGYEGPTGPPIPTSYNVRGVVRDAQTGQAIAGATITSDLGTATTWGDGSYTQGPTYLRAITMTVTKEGYVTTQRQLALNTPEVVSNFLLTPAP